MYGALNIEGCMHNTQMLDHFTLLYVIAKLIVKVYKLGTLGGQYFGHVCILKNGNELIENDSD